MIENEDLYRLPLNLHMHYTCPTTGCKVTIKNMYKIAHTPCGMPEQKAWHNRAKLQVLYVSGQVCFRNNECIETAFSREKQHWKMLGLHSLDFWKEAFKAPPPVSPLVGRTEESLHFNGLFACSSPKSGNRSRPVLSVSEPPCRRNSRKSHRRWTPAAILLWLKANAFYCVGAPSLLFLVGIKLLWKSCAMVAEATQENEQLLWPRDEQSSQGALKCRCLSRCSSPLTARRGMQLRPPDTTDHVEVLTHVHSCACLPFLPPLGPELKATYARLRFVLLLACSASASLRGQDQWREGASRRISLNYNQTVGFFPRLWTKLSPGQDHWKPRRKSDDVLTNSPIALLVLLSGSGILQPLCCFSVRELLKTRSHLLQTREGKGSQCSRWARVSVKASPCGAGWRDRGGGAGR